MKRQHLFTGICGLLAAITSVAAPKKPLVVLSNGERRTAKSIVAVPGGGLKIIDSKGKPVALKAGRYKEAYVPEPTQVAALEKALEKKQYDSVIKFAPLASQKFGVLGWGDKLAYLEGTAYLAKKQPEKAAEAFTKGKAFKGTYFTYGDELARGRVLAMLALGKLDSVRADLDTMVRSRRKSDAAMALNARGQILAKEGKSKEAVLEYLKTLLLFDSGNKGVAPFREEARKQVVALMRKMGDPKWRMFVDME